MFIDEVLLYRICLLKCACIIFHSKSKLFTYQQKVKQKQSGCYWTIAFRQDACQQKKSVWRLLCLVFWLLKNISRYLRKDENTCFVFVFGHPHRRLNLVI